MKPKHPAAGRGHKALACEQRRIVNCNIQGRHALDSVSRVLLLGVFAHFMVGTLPPSLPPSRSFELSANIHIETADANTIKARDRDRTHPSFRNRKESCPGATRRRTARRREGERHRLEKQLGGSSVGAGDDYACSNERTWSTGGPRARGERGSSQGRSFRRL